MLKLIFSIFTVTFIALVANIILKITPYDSNSVINKTKDHNTTHIKYVSVGTKSGVNLNTIEIGDKTKDKHKPLMILLHGFPETALTTWHEQLNALADTSKYYVLAPDLRGYNKSDRPENFMDYHFVHLISDVHSLIHGYAGRKEAYIVSHDWGALIAWRFAQTYPESVTKLIVINVPHPSAFNHLVKRASWQQILTQLSKSWYIAFFQLPAPLPEYRFLSNNYSTPKASIRDLTKSGKVSEKQLEHYVQGWSEPGALTAMMNYYRAFLIGNIYGKIKDFVQSTSYYKLPSADETIKKPTMLIWGKDDLALEFVLAEYSYEYGVDESVKSESRFVPLEGVSHFATNDAPDKITQLILEFCN